MLTQRLANVAFAILVLLAAVWFGSLALDFQESGLLATSGLSSKFFPLTILTVVVACGLVVLWQYTAGGVDDEHEKVFGHWVEALRGAMIFGVAIACFLIWSRFGFIPMALVIGPACAFVMGVRSVPVHALLVVVGYVIYLIFSGLLGIQIR